jgi:hypothetical protein
MFTAAIRRHCPIRDSAHGHARRGITPGVPKWISALSTSRHVGMGADTGNNKSLAGANSCNTIRSDGIPRSQRHHSCVCSDGGRDR